MIFHRVHKSIEEVCPVFEPAVKHFILAETEEQEHTRTVVFAIFTARFEFFGACYWTPVTQVWDVLDLCGGERVDYLSQQSAAPTSESHDSPGGFLCLL